MGGIRTRVLSCGMPLIVETMPGVRSAGLAWLVPAGSAHDPGDRQGLSTLWSELLLRGAGDLDSRAQADAFDRLGVGRSADVGGMNMHLRASMIGSKMGGALPLIADMIRRPRLDDSAIEPARDLALQSLASLKDDPQERAVLGARARHLPEPLNRSGLGTEEGLTGTTKQDLAAWWSARARPGGSILALAGDVDADAVAALLDDLLHGWSGAAQPMAPGPAPARGYAHETDQTNQVQVVLVHDAPPEPSPDALLEKVVVSVLSGGMSGRLFSEVREKRGLCYAVSAGYRGEREFGLVQAYVGTTPERAQESIDVLWGELNRVHTPAGAITPEEFQRAVIGMKSRLVFSGESSSARAGALAGDQFRLGRPRGLDEIARELDALTLDRVNAYLARRALGRVTVQTLGPAPLRPPAGVGAPV